MDSSKSTFILDTSVLIHDPEALRNFRDTAVVIPIFVVMELDDLKTNPRHEVSSSARTASRRLVALMDHGSLHDPEGVLDPETNTRVYVVGNEKGPMESLRESASSRKMDLLILGVALSMQERFKDRKTVLVSKDVNLRILADSAGLKAEDYDKDRTPVSEIPSGIRRADGVEQYCYTPGATTEEAQTFEFDGEVVRYNEFVLGTGKNPALVRYTPKGRLVPVPKTFRNLGITPRNLEQRMALDLLMDPAVQLVTLLGMAGCGKAQPLDSKVMTPTGWVPMGALKVGDEVMTPDGSSAPILGVFPQGDKETFRVHFTDGTFAECCKEHLWHTRTASDRNNGNPGSVKSLGEIMTSLRVHKDGRRNHSIPMTHPIGFKENALPMDPYLMGCLLGDGGMSSGCLSFTTADPDIIKECEPGVKAVGCEFVSTGGFGYTIVHPEGVGGPPSHKFVRRNPTTGEEQVYETMKEVVADGFTTSVYKACRGANALHRGYEWRMENSPLHSTHPVRNALMSLGLWGHRAWSKFIPPIYLLGSVTQREALLQGLLDTDGTVGKGGEVSFTTTSPTLADGIRHLVESLGGTASVTHRTPRFKYKGEPKNGKVAYTCFIHLPGEIRPFRLARKISRLKTAGKDPMRYIDRVEQVGSKPSQCILVGHPDHLYLTDHCIVTHNTFLALAACLAQLDGAYDRIILSKPVVAMGRDLGYLPGTEAEKLQPWMLSFFDNLDQLFAPGTGETAGRKGVKEKSYEQLLHSRKVEVQPLHSIRGRSIAKAIMLVDEAQNMTPHEVKTVVSRAATGTKVILCGDPYQIDDAYLDTLTNGLVHAAVSTLGNPIAGTVTLTEGVRSPLSELAATKL